LIKAKCVIVASSRHGVDHYHPWDIICPLRGNPSQNIACTNMTKKMVFDHVYMLLGMD
jgi:hypothetical protein